MIVESMTRKEIADHVRGELTANFGRIENKMAPIIKKMWRNKISTFDYEQITPNKTKLHFYIYAAYVSGVWYQTEKGKVFAVCGKHHVAFYNEHFFIRYAERCLSRPNLSAMDAAREYYRTYSIGIAFKDEESPIADGVYRVSLHLDGGIGLGFEDVNLDLSVYNTFVSAAMLKGAQVVKHDECRQYREAVNWLDRNDPEQFDAYLKAIKDYKESRQ